MTLVTASL